MCVIAFAPTPTDYPTREQLVRACEANSDGFGWAVIAGSEIVRHRTMNAVEAIDSYLDMVEWATGPSLFHARVASHGSVDLGNCHPFMVGGDPSVVLAHNGILDINPGPLDTRSDTAILVEDVMPRSGIETLDTRPDAWEKWIGPGNKIVILSTNPLLARPAYVLNESEGVWDNGVWWSNRSYLLRDEELIRFAHCTYPDECDGCVKCDGCGGRVSSDECITVWGEHLCRECSPANYDALFDEDQEYDRGWLCPVDASTRSQW